MTSLELCVCTWRRELQPNIEFLLKVFAKAILFDIHSLYNNYTA